MKSLKVSQCAKKLFAGTLPVAFLFVTMFYGNVTYATAPTTVKVLAATSSTGFTAITDGESRDYSQGGHYKDSQGTAGAGKGTISYSTDNGVGVLTLDSLDLTTTKGLIEADGGNGNLEIVLKGNNIITLDSSAINALLVEGNNLKISGDGTLTVNEGSNSGSAILMENSNIEFAGDSVITLNQSTDHPAIDFNVGGSLIITKGTVNVNQTGKGNAVAVKNETKINGGTLNIVQSATVATDGSPVNALNCDGDITITNSNVNATIVNQDSKGMPIYSDKGNITINNSNVKAIGSGVQKNSPYGIGTKASNKTTINKGSVVEMYGKEAANFEQVAIDDTVSWEVTAGESPESAKKLKETKASDILAKLKANKYSYVKLASQDKLPKTGDNTSVMQYILLLVAGAFTVMVVNKKKVFED